MLWSLAPLCFAGGHCFIVLQKKRRANRPAFISQEPAYDIGQTDARYFQLIQ